MKIENIETFQLQSPLSIPFGWSQDIISNRSIGLVKITTNEGLVGWGEGCNGPSGKIIDDVLFPLLKGDDPTNISAAWAKMFHVMYNSNSVVGFGGSAISAIDIALWDIYGKSTGQPIHKLLGGKVRDSVPVYATGLYYTKNEFPKNLLKEAADYVDQGFLGMKTKVGGLPIQKDVDRVKAIRNEIGPDIKLMIDANQAYNAYSAIRIANKLYDQDLMWFEEPVNAQDIEAYLQVKSKSPMAIAGGENLRTRYEFQNFFAKRAYDIAQPDVINVGGITELRNVAMTANTFGIQVNPHVWGSPIMISASLNVASTIPLCPPSFEPEPFVQESVMEYDRTPSAIRDELCRDQLKFENGRLFVPEKPGLGIEIDENNLQKLISDD